VTQWGYLQMVTHLGQSSASQALSGHLISHSGFSHFTSHTAFLGSWQLVWHLEGLFKLKLIIYLVLTNWVTDCRAFRIVAFPGALRVAVGIR